MQPPVDEDVALRAIVEGVEAETGEGFFPVLVERLAAALEVQYAFVSELVDAESFRTRALWGRGALMDNVTVPIHGTPCEAVLAGEAAHHPENLCALFPEDPGLLEWRAESYCGVPLLDPVGAVVGHLAIVDDQPMLDGPRGLSILRIFAARARAEIERQRMLEALRASEHRLARVLDSAMDAIVTIDTGGRIDVFNRAAERILGCAAADALGTSVERFLSEGLERAVSEATQSLRAEGAPPCAWVPNGLRARRADGREIEVELTASRLEIGSVEHFTLVLRDVEAYRLLAEDVRRLDRHRVYLEEEIRSIHNFDDIIGQNRALREVLAMVDRVAPTDSSVLILGETGTGKEIIARALHARSRRHGHPLIKINCAALPSTLIESELFGHERGAFTGATDKRVGRFELADGGTIFLDEVGEIPADVQSKLLRVLQEHEFERVGGSRTLRADVRVIAATNRDLETGVREGTFREDLYYRLNVFPVRLPPLRDRRDDIPLLVEHFVGRYAAKVGRRIERVPPDVVDRLCAYGWPGNVRELENVIERAVILSAGPDLEVEDAFAAPSAARRGGDAAEIRAGTPTRLRSETPRGATDQGVKSLEQIEREHIVRALRETGWRIEGGTGAARVLGIPPSTLRDRMAKLEIRRTAETEV